MSNIDFEKYQEFVLAVCSEDSKNLDKFIERLEELRDNYDPETQSYGPQVNIPLLLTAGIGLASESGEAAEIIKKIAFHGKKLDEHTVWHLKREAGDAAWYLANMCNALGFSLQDVLNENVKKLEARYPGGFSAFLSENRAEGDL